ncbi:MAG: hypothetical protein WCQ00_03810 [bacterium]
MKKVVFALSVFIFTIVSIPVFAQSNNWADYGLSEGSVKYLTEAEKQNILNSLTPDQTIKKQKEELEKTGSSSFPFVPGSVLLGKTPDAKLSSEVVNCFDYYTFGSVSADMSSQSSSAVSGMDMNFFGNIKNNNKYPIVQGTLYVKIFKNVGGEKNPNGPDVVDQFIAVDNLAIPANGSIPTSFTWKVPTYAQSGDYRLVTFFIVDKKFNLLGLSFTDDVVGNSFNFKVDGEKTGVMFNKSSVVINAIPYYFAAYPPRIKKEDDVKISLSVENTTKIRQVTQVKWKLYQWDSINPKNLIREFTTEIEIASSSSKKIELSIPEKDAPVYYLVGELVYKDSKSVVGIRFVRDEVDKVRLNFPSITSFPLKKGESSTLFTCLHNSGQSSQVPNNKLLLEIKDEKGKVIESYSYEGIVTGDMMAVKKDFISKVDLDVFSVHAVLFNNDKIVDESTMNYDCKLIDPTKCNKRIFSPIFLTIVGIIVLFFGFIFIKKYKNRIKENIILPIVILTFFLNIIFFPLNTVEAMTTISSDKTVTAEFYYFWNRWSSSGWSRALINPQIKVDYKIEIIDTSTGLSIKKGDNVNVGTTIKLSFLKHESTDISWTGTGYSQDSPYGDWGNSMPTYVKNPECLDKDYVSTTLFEYVNYKAYIPLMISPPVESISNTNNMSCGQLLNDEKQGYTMTCTINSAGGISPIFSFGQTSGKFYYRYYDPRTGSTGYPPLPLIPGCYGNNIPLETLKTPATMWANLTTAPYQYNISASSYTYDFTAVVPPPVNKSPNPPTVIGPDIGNTGTPYSFAVQATDPDVGDSVKYTVDWNNDGVGDTYLPSTGFVSSGLSQDANKTWGSSGKISFKARTEDNHGATSSWVTHSIDINELINGSCNNSIKDACYFGNTVDPRDVGSQFTWVCSGLYGGASSGTCSINKSPINGSCNNNVKDACYFGSTGNSAVTSTQYTWICGGLYGGVSSSVCSINRPAESASCGNLVDVCSVGTFQPSIDSTDADIWSCLGINGGSSLTCILKKPIVGEYIFNPSTTVSGGKCKLYLNVSNVSFCYVKNRYNQVTVPSSSLPVTNSSISINGGIPVSVGTHTLFCKGLGENSIEQSLGSRSCVINGTFGEI